MHIPLRFGLITFLFSFGILSLPAQEARRHAFDAEIQFRKLLSNDHIGINFGYRFKDRHEVRYGVYYLLQDAVFWDDNHYLVKTFRPDKLYQHFGWSFSYAYRIFSFKNGSRISVGFDLQQNRSRTQTFTYSGKVGPWRSIMEGHIITRSVFPISKQVAFTFQGGLGGIFQSNMSRPKNLAYQFLPFYAREAEGFSYHLAFGIRYNLNKLP